MALRIVRTACLLVAGGVVMVGCSSPIPAPAAATPTPGLGDALRQELGTLQTCLEASTTALSEANAVCYEGFSYTLDGYTWPSAVSQAGGHAACRRLDACNVPQWHKHLQMQRRLDHVQHRSGSAAQLCPLTSAVCRYALQVRRALAHAC